MSSNCSAVSLLVFILSIYAHDTFGQKCDDVAQKDFDSTFAKLLTLGGSGRRFPEDKKTQLKSFCDDSFVYIQDIDKYKAKCMKQMPKQVTGVIVYSVKKLINKYCKRDSRALTDLISSTTCANRAKKEIDKCYSTLIDNFQGAYNAVDKLRIPHICCEYFQFYDCVSDGTEKNANCNEHKVNIFTNFVREIFSSTVDLICGDYVEGSDKCLNLGPSPKKRKSQRRTKSFMIPLIEALASLPDN